jgi:multimeric flavodoxin WrbA
VEDALESADVIVLASPVHWGNMSGIMLRTLERLFGFMIQEQKLGAPKKRRAKGKRAVLITSCSTPWPLNWVFNQTRAVFSRFKEVCRYSGLEIVDKVAAPGMFHSRDLSDKVRTRARKAGRRLRAS